MNVSPLNVILLFMTMFVMMPFSAGDMLVSFTFAADDDDASFLNVAHFCFLQIMVP